MHRTLGEDYIEVGGKRLYQNANPPTVKATRLPAASMNAIQEEICNVIEKAGLTLNTDDSTDEAAGWDQLWDAITTRGIFGSAALADNAVTGVKGYRECSEKLVDEIYAEQTADILGGTVHVNGNAYNTAPGSGIYLVTGHDEYNYLPLPASISPQAALDYAGVSKYTNGILLVKKATTNSWASGTLEDYLGSKTNVDRIFIGIEVTRSDSGTSKSCYHVWARHDAGDYDGSTPLEDRNLLTPKFAWKCVHATDLNGYDYLANNKNVVFSPIGTSQTRVYTSTGSEHLVMLQNWYENPPLTFLEDFNELDITLSASMKLGHKTHYTFRGKTNAAYFTLKFIIPGTIQFYDISNWGLTQYGATGTYTKTTACGDNQDASIEFDIEFGAPGIALCSPGFILTNLRISVV